MSENVTLYVVARRYEYLFVTSTANPAFYPEYFKWTVEKIPSSLKRFYKEDKLFDNYWLAHGKAERLNQGLE